MKKIVNLLTLTLLIIAGVIAEGKAQSGDIVSMEVTYKSHIKLSNPSDTLNPTSDIVYTVLVSDTAKVTKIAINAGKAKEGKDIFNFSFKLDEKKVDLPARISYLRIGNTLIVTVADVPLYADYYYQVNVEDKSGKVLDSQTYHYK